MKRRPARPRQWLTPLVRGLVALAASVALCAPEAALAHPPAVAPNPLDPPLLPPPVEAPPVIEVPPAPSGSGADAIGDPYEPEPEIRRALDPVDVTGIVRPEREIS